MPEQSDKAKPKKTPKRFCSVCDERIKEFGHACKGPAWLRKV